MSFSNRMVRVKDYVSAARIGIWIGISLRIGSSRSIVVWAGVLGASCPPAGGEAGSGAESASASGISAMQTYPARREMYNQSTTAKYASIRQNMTAITSRGGATRAKASGIETAVVATLKAARCASPLQVLTAQTGPR